MPRRRRICPVGIPVHLIQRGNNRQICFTSNEDSAAYANWLREAAEKYEVDIHAWVFMTNHVHLLVTPRREGAVSDLMQYVGRYYVRYFNWSYERTGTLFEGRFKASIVQSEQYFLSCQRYIELNPVRAGLVTDPADYVWSSYRTHALGRSTKMWTPHSAYIELGENVKERQKHYRELFKEELDDEVISDIRSSVNTGIVFGTEEFRDQVEKLTGQRQRLLPRGRKRKSKD